MAFHAVTCKAGGDSDYALRPMPASAGCG